MDDPTRRDVLKVAGVAGTALLSEHVLSAAPGRGSSGVHESGFSPFDPKTLSLPRREGLIPTLTIVDDTFTAHQREMAAVIREARLRAGLG